MYSIKTVEAYIKGEDIENILSKNWKMILRLCV